MIEGKEGKNARHQQSAQKSEKKKTGQQAGPTHTRPARRKNKKQRGQDGQRQLFDRMVSTGDSSCERSTSVREGVAESTGGTSKPQIRARIGHQILRREYPAACLLCLSPSQNLKKECNERSRILERTQTGQDGRTDSRAVLPGSDFTTTTTTTTTHAARISRTTSHHLVFRVLGARVHLLLLLLLLDPRGVT